MKRSHKRHRLSGIACTAAAAAAAIVLSSCATGIPAPQIVSAGEWTGDPVVSTRFGFVQGYADNDLTWVWRAIPYAAPPVGELRWRAPRDPAPWNGVRAGRRFSSGCTQLLFPHLGVTIGSEDCLYLNVWRPRSVEQHLPVYVWVHGGGNCSGSSTELPAYYGNRVAARSRMVFVSVDYRLGPFGWFAEPALRDGGSPQDTSGNYGTLDLIKALGWIRDNISAFGGDPSLVTLTGQSAGAADVLSLLLSPLATGRFQRAICESGARSAAPLSTGEARSFRTLCALLVNDRKAASLAEAERAAAAMSPEAIRSYLRSRSDREILHCYPSDSAGIIDNPGPFLDGYVMPSEGFGRLETGDYPNKIPLIIGSNKEELKLFLMQDGVPWRSEEYAAVAQWGSELWKAGGVDAVARDLAAAPGQPAVYVYRFDWGAPDADGRSVEPGEWGTRLGAFHGLEIPFMLGQDRLEIFADPLVFSRANEPGRKALSSAMMSYAAQFARTGNPNTRGSGLPIWDAWANDSGAPKFIVFDARDDSPSLLMSDAELTREGVMASLENSVSEPLLGKVEEFLSMLRTELQIE